MQGANTHHAKQVTPPKLRVCHRKQKMRAGRNGINTILLQADTHILGVVVVLTIKYHMNVATRIQCAVKCKKVVQYNRQWENSVVCV